MSGATIGVAIGFLQAHYLRDRGGFSRRFVEPLLSLPLGIPGIILGLGLLILLIRTPLYGTPHLRHRRRTTTRRDFVPWRFSAAGHRSAGKGRPRRRLKPCTGTDDR